MEKHIHRKIFAYLFMALCAIIPWSLAGMQIMLGLLCAYFIILSVLHRKNLLRKNVFYIFLAAHLVSLIISATFSVNLITSFDNILHTYWVILTVPIIASLPLTNFYRTKAINVLIFSSAVVGLYAIFQFFSGINLIGDAHIGKLGSFYRSIGSYSFYLTLAGNQLMIFAFAFTFAMQKDLTLNKKLLYILAIILIGLSLISTQGRSAWLGATLIILLGTFLFYRNYFWKILSAFVVIFLTIVIALPDVRDRFMAIFSTSHQANLTRVNLWMTSFLIIKDHFVVGVGPGHFQQFFELYKVEGFYDAAGHAHNDYLHILVQSGILGLITWLMIWIAFFKQGITYVYLQKRESSDTPIVKGSVLAIAGILVAALFQCYFVDLENSILWWVLVATAIQIFNQDKEVEN